MNKLCLAAVFGIGLAFAATGASAFPVAPLSSSGSDVMTVADGCGPGYFRGPRGRCRPMGGMRDRGARIVIPTVRRGGTRCRIVIDSRGRREVCVTR